MLFATNRIGHPLDEGARIEFPLHDNRVSQRMTFCLRQKKDHYQQLESDAFFQQLSNLTHGHILLYIHGFNNTGEQEIFPHACLLQELFYQSPEMPEVYVIPLIWPCDDQSIWKLVDDYLDDQHAADASPPAFSEFFSLLEQWQQQESGKGKERQLHVLAHSMGNRVLSNALLARSKQTHFPFNKLFRYTFMVAADVVSRAFEVGQRAEFVPEFSHNVVVYFAKDDMALLASQCVNVLKDGFSRRLGQQGPAQFEELPEHVYLVDCDLINEHFDLSLLPLPHDGHEYYLTDIPNQTVSPVFFHIANAIKEGRVMPDTRVHQLAFANNDG